MTKDKKQEQEIQSLKRALAEAKWMLLGIETYLEGRSQWTYQQCKEFNDMTYNHTREALKKIYTEQRYRQELEETTPIKDVTLTYVYCSTCDRSMECEQHNYTSIWSCCNCGKVCQPGKLTPKRKED